MADTDGDAWSAWQHALSAALSPDAGDRAVRAVLSLAHGEPDLNARRLARWRGGRAVLHDDVLAHAYPAVRHAIGLVAFPALARAYTLRHPSRDGDLGRFGCRLPAFLAHDASTRPWRALSAVARLEWAVHRLHRAADAPPLDAGDVALLCAESLGCLMVRLHPSCRLLMVPRAALACWHAFHADRGLVDTSAVMASSHDGANSAVLVYRQRYRMAVREVDAAEREALARLRRGCTMASALEAAAGDREEPSDVGGIFARWLGDGLLVVGG